MTSPDDSIDGWVWDGTPVGYYWTSPAHTHGRYCAAVSKLIERFLAQHGITRKEATAAQGEILLQAIRASDDPDIRDYNEDVRARAAEMQAHYDNNGFPVPFDDDRAQQFIWEILYNGLGQIFDPLGQRDGQRKGDFWILDENCGYLELQVEVQRLDLFSPAVVEQVQGMLGDELEFWEVTMIVDLPGHEDWPKMGLSITHLQVVDHLKREYLPPEHRYVYGPPLKGVMPPPSR